MRQALVVFALAATTALLGCSRSAPDPRTLPRLVAVTAVGSDGQSGQVFTGVIRARVESDLGFRVAGKVIARLVDAGQAVHKGQPLMRLDPADLALASSAQAAAVVVARARYLQTAADLKRSQGLVEAGSLSASAFDQTKADADAAEAQLKSAQAQADVATHNLDYAVLTADSDGIIEDTSAEPGQVVAAGQTVVRIAHAGQREALVSLPETVRPAIGSNAQGQLYSLGNAVFTARLRQLSQSADPITRTYDARYVLSGQASDAPLGATVTITLPSGVAAPRRDVPLGAIYDPGSGPGVWRVVSDHVHFQRVALLGLGADTAAVGGIQAGTRIVALGADVLREGQEVRTEPLPGTEVAREPQQ